MGTFIGHIAPGAGFLIIGLWHLLNTLRNYARSPWNFESRPWFPSRLCGGKLRHIELYAIMGGSLLSIAAELFIGPERHQPLDDHHSIPPEHLHNFEHSTVSLFFFMYALAARLADTGGRSEPSGGVARMLPAGLVQLMGALAFAQELLLFHFHSTDHMGLEGHYHWLLQLIICVSIACMLMEVAWPQSFHIALLRVLSVVFQGVWLIHMGFVLWMPAFTPRGCALKQEELHEIVRCGTKLLTMRAKGLATLQFSWDLAAVTVFAMAAVVLALRRYTPAPNYETIDDAVTAHDQNKVEMAKQSYKSRVHCGSDSSMESFPMIQLER